MKKIIICVFLLTFINLLYGENPKIKFYDNYSVKVINKINYFRNLSFIDKIFAAGFNLTDMFNSNIPLVECFNCSDFIIDENLMEYAKERVIEIITNKDISHKYLKDSFSGEGIFVLAFQNYINIDYAVKIFLKNIFRSAVLRDNRETVFMYYPYNLIGAAIATTSIEFEGLKYNIVILVVETVLVEDKKGEDFYGRIFNLENACEDCNIEVNDINGRSIVFFKTFLDGSFFINGLPSQFYLKYNDKIIFIDLKNYDKNIEF